MRGRETERERERESAYWMDLKAMAPYNQGVHVAPTVGF